MSAKACVTSNRTNIAIVNDYWSLVDDDSGRWGPLTAPPGEGLPGPAYPSFAPVGPGECIKGWLYFEHAKGTKMITVRYDGQVEQARWSL